MNQGILFPKESKETQSMINLFRGLTVNDASSAPPQETIDNTSAGQAVFMRVMGQSYDQDPSIPFEKKLVHAIHYKTLPANVVLQNITFTLDKPNDYLDIPNKLINCRVNAGAVGVHEGNLSLEHPDAMGIALGPCKIEAFGKKVAVVALHADAHISIGEKALAICCVRNVGVRILCSRGMGSVRCGDASAAHAYISENAQTDNAYASGVALLKECKWDEAATLLISAAKQENPLALERLKEAIKENADFVDYVTHEATPAILGELGRLMLIKMNDSDAIHLFRRISEGFYV